MAEENNNQVPEEEQTFEDSMNNVAKWVQKNLSGIFAVLIALFFIFYGLVEVIPTQLGIKEQIIMAFVNIVAGFSITSLVGEYGFRSAKESNKFTNVEKEYNKSVENALPYREEINEMAIERANQNLKANRTYILEGARILYSDVFNENGSLNMDFDIYKYKNDKGFYKKLRAYHRAVKMKVLNTNVFGMSNSSLFGIRKEKTESQYRLEKGSKSGIIKLLLGTVSTGVMFVFLGWSWGSVIYAFMQVVLWVGFGLIDRQKNYNFIIDEILPQLTMRRYIIEEFMKKSVEEKKLYTQKVFERKNPPKQIPCLDMDKNIK